MSNTYTTNINKEKKITRHNEEETTTVEIDKILDLRDNTNNTQINVTKNNEYSNDDPVKNNKLENVMIKSNEFELLEKDRKSQSIWVQCSRLYFKRTSNIQQKQKKQPDKIADPPLVPFSYDPRSRNQFLKFVFILLFLMFAITADYVVLVMITGFLKQFYQDWGVILLISSLDVLITINYVMAGSLTGTLKRAAPGRARVLPCNFISLFIGVLAMSNLVAALTILFDTNIFVLGVIATLFTVALCVLLACSRFDFRNCYIYLVVFAMAFVAIALVVLIELSVMGMKFTTSKILFFIFGTLIQIIVLMIELQLVLGRQTIEIGEEDYALTAYLLYAPWVDIFMQIIRLFRFSDE